VCHRDLKFAPGTFLAISLVDYAENAAKKIQPYPASAGLNVRAMGTSTHGPYAPYPSNLLSAAHAALAAGPTIT